MYHVVALLQPPLESGKLFLLFFCIWPHCDSTSHKLPLSVKEVAKPAMHNQVLFLEARKAAAMLCFEGCLEPFWPLLMSLIRSSSLLLQPAERLLLLSFCSNAKKP